MIPVRCFTCGKVVGNLYEPYILMLRATEKTEEKVLDELRIRRFCCRRMIISHVERIDTMLLAQEQEREQGREQEQGREEEQEQGREVYAIKTD
jgi:DNA-directed RNA polymerase I, II, and III subunit RPABC5